MGLAQVIHEVSERRAADDRRNLAVLAGAIRLHCEHRGVNPDEVPGALGGAGGRLAKLVASKTGVNRAVRLRMALESRQIESDEFIGRVYLATYHDDASRARLGATYTPPEVAASLLDLLDEPGLTGEAAPEGEFRALDPACGCGAFVLPIFDRLHGAFVREMGLTPAEAARLVIARHLSGCDIDTGAVEVCRILLAVRALAAGCKNPPRPNIFAADFLGAERPVKAAPHVIVGNPPFVEGRRISRAVSLGLKRRFRASSGKVNLASCFVERGLECLAEGGTLAYVLPGAILRNERYWAVREVVLSHRLECAVSVRELPFDGRVVDAALVTVSKDRPTRSHTTRVALVESIAAAPGIECRRVPQELFVRSKGYRINVMLSAGSLRLLAKIREGGAPMETFFTTRDGISTGFQPFPQIILGTRRGEYFINRRGDRQPFSARRHRPVIDGAEISAYGPVAWQGRFVLYDKNLEHHPKPPKGRPFNCQLRDPAIFDRPAKVLTRQTANRLIAALDRDRHFCRNSIHVTYPKEGLEEAVSLEALMMLLNSRLMNYYYRMSTQETGRAFPQVHIRSLRDLPIAEEVLDPYGELAVLGRLAATPGIEPPELADVVDRAEGVIGEGYRLSAADVTRIDRYAARTLHAVASDTRAAG